MHKIMKIKHNCYCVAVFTHIVKLIPHCCWPAASIQWYKSECFDKIVDRRRDRQTDRAIEMCNGHSSKKTHHGGENPWTRPRTILANLSVKWRSISNPLTGFWFLIVISQEEDIYSLYNVCVALQSLSYLSIVNVVTVCWADAECSTGVHISVISNYFVNSTLNFIFSFQKSDSKSNS